MAKGLRERMQDQLNTVDVFDEGAWRRLYIEALQWESWGIDDSTRIQLAIDDLLSALDHTPLTLSKPADADAIVKTIRAKARDIRNAAWAQKRQEASFDRDSRSQAQRIRDDRARAVSEREFKLLNLLEVEAELTRGEDASKVLYTLVARIKAGEHLR